MSQDGESVKPYAPGDQIEHMVLADSFTLPDLSDDEEDSKPLSAKMRGAEPLVAGRSVRAAARTTGGAVRLTDGFGEFTAAVPGRRTAMVDRPKSNDDEDKEEGGSDDDFDDDKEKASLKEKSVAVPVDPSTLPPALADAPVGKAPPFVWTPGQFVSVEKSDIRTASVLDADALDSVAFVCPRTASTSAKPRASSDSRRAISKAYAGPGRPSSTQLHSSEIAELSLLRGTSFSPFSVQLGRPRGEWTHDAPWDRTQRNVVAQELWRKQGDDCDRTVLPTTKQGHAPRTLGLHAASSSNTATANNKKQQVAVGGQSERRRGSGTAAGGGGGGAAGGGGGFEKKTRGGFSLSRMGDLNVTGLFSSEEEEEEEEERLKRGGGLSAGNSSGRHVLADPTGVVGGAGRRGGALKYTTTTNNGSKSPSPTFSSGRRHSAAGAAEAGKKVDDEDDGGGLVVPFSSTFLSTCTMSTTGAAGGGVGSESRPGTAPSLSGGEAAGGGGGSSSRPGTAGAPAAAAAASSSSLFGASTSSSFTGPPPPVSLSWAHLNGAGNKSRRTSNMCGFLAREEAAAAASGGGGGGKIEALRQGFMDAVKGGDDAQAQAAYKEFMHANSNATALQQQQQQLQLQQQHGSSSSSQMTSPITGGPRRQRPKPDFNEYLIHDDPLSRLDPSVLQLLNEKNIALRLFPPSRSDTRQAIRTRFATSSDKYKDAHVIGYGLLDSRSINQSLESAAGTHPTDEVDALSPPSLVQKSRRGPEFPVPPWDGTMRNIAAKDIGLWRDPGWDLRAPKGDAKLHLRSTTSSLIDS